MIMRTEGGKLKGVFFLLILMWEKRDYFFLENVPYIHTQLK